VSGPVIDAAVTCPHHDGPTKCLAQPETDGDWKYYEGSECHNTFGFVRIADPDPSDGACAMGVTAARPAGPAFLGPIGRRPE
jgi:hypothetical protein